MDVSYKPCCPNVVAAILAETKLQRSIKFTCLTSVTSSLPFKLDWCLLLIFLALRGNHNPCWKGAIVFYQNHAILHILCHRYLSKQSEFDCCLLPTILSKFGSQLLLKRNCNAWYIQEFWQSSDCWSSSQIQVFWNFRSDCRPYIFIFQQ